MPETDPLFEKFLKTDDTLWICQGKRVLFTSREKGLAPLLRYIEEFPVCPAAATACDRIVGNAAALLLQRASCREVYSAVGSQLAIETLKRSGVAYVFLTVVPHIPDRTGSGMCPFEKASIGKTPQEFYEFAKESVLRKARR